MKTYFEQLKPQVLNHLENFKDDFLVHDNKELSYLWKRAQSRTECTKGEFILGVRSTGTDILSLDDITAALDDLKNERLTSYFSVSQLYKMFTGQYGELLNMFSFVAFKMTNRNKWFFYGVNGKTKQISIQDKDQLIEDKILNPLWSICKDKNIKDHIDKNIMWLNGELIEA